MAVRLQTTARLQCDAVGSHRNDNGILFNLDFEVSFVRGNAMHICSFARQGGTCS
jgi:hypothetical protein